MDWNDLHYFVTLVEQQTLTGAAETLNVQHSTVSRRIAQLESALGLRLFDRIGKRYLLTDDGRRIHAQAQEVAVNMRVLQRLAREQREEIDEVVVSAPPVAAQVLLMPHFADFGRLHPNIRLTLQSSVMISNLHDRQADIALRVVKPEADDLVACRLRDVHYRLYAHPEYLKNTPRHDWAFFALNGHGTHGEFLSKQLIGRKIIFSSNDFSLIKTAITAKTGIGLLPDFYVRVEDGLLPVHLNDNATPETFSRALYLVMHEDLRRSPKVRKTADFLIERLQVTDQ